MLKRLFGYFTVFDLEKHRNEYPYCDYPTFYKKKFIIWYRTPKWMRGWFEGIEFRNLYYGTPEDAYYKGTNLMFVTMHNVYWIVFRESPIGRGDWKLCLKFKKLKNDHVSCG